MHRIEPARHVTLTASSHDDNHHDDNDDDDDGSKYIHFHSFIIVRCHGFFFFFFLYRSSSDRAFAEERKFSVSILMIYTESDTFGEPVYVPCAHCNIYLF